MTNIQTFLNWALLRLLAICASPLALSPLFQWLAVAPSGTTGFLWLEMFIIFPLLAALLVILITPFFLFVRRFRCSAARTLLATVVFAASALTGIRLGERVRMRAFHQLAERSAPLVRAIRAYEAQHGAPPPDLHALVPDFLPSIPRTGMAAYPSYRYHIGAEAARYDKNPWALVVFTPTAGINFDKFMYFPLQNYPKTGYGGWLERIGDWAYVHE